MQIVEAAADRCELLWLVDQTLGDNADMFPLLRRYGTVIDISGSSSREAAAILAPYKPAGLVSYFDAGLVLLAETAEHLGLPFHSPGTAALLVDKLRQHEALAGGRLGDSTLVAIACRAHCDGPGSPTRRSLVAGHPQTWYRIRQPAVAFQSAS